MRDIAAGRQRRVQILAGKPPCRGGVGEIQQPTISGGDRRHRPPAAEAAEPLARRECLAQESGDVPDGVRVAVVIARARLDPDDRFGGERHSPVHVPELRLPGPLEIVVEG
jgi:hypothetical protein